MTFVAEEAERTEERWWGEPGCITAEQTKAIQSGRFPLPRETEREWERERYKNRHCLNRLCSMKILKIRHLMQILWNDYTFGSDGAQRMALQWSCLSAGLKGRPSKLACCILMRTALKSEDTTEQTSGVCKRLCCASFSVWFLQFHISVWNPKHSVKTAGS